MDGFERTDAAGGRSGLQRSGAVRLIVDCIAPARETSSPLVALAAVYLLASALTEAVTNDAVAVVVTPLAVGLAAQPGAEPRPFVVAVMFGASPSFATPVGYKTNTLAYGAENYRFADFVKIGLPMKIIVGAAVVLSIPMFYSF